MELTIRFKTAQRELLWRRLLGVCRLLASSPIRSGDAGCFLAASLLRTGRAAALEDADDRRIQREQRARHMLDTYGDSILRLSYSYVHNMEDAEEILQDTLIRVLEKAPAFQDAAQEKAYLLRTAANLSRNRIDYNRVRAADELQDTLAAEQQEDLSYVWQAVKALPENYRAAIHLFYEEGYGTKEIARILGRKEATVRSDLKRGRERLKQILKEDYGYV